MRLLFTYPFCGLGGVETSILNKIEALRKADIEGHVLFGDFYGSSGQTLSDDPRVTVTSNVSEVRALLGQDFDAISVVDHPDFVDLLDALQATPIAIAESHTSFPHALQRLYRNLNHPRIAAVVVPSHFNRGLVNGVLHDSKEIVVIRNPLDGTRFRPSPPQTEEALPLQITGPVVLWVGRLENEKNPAELIEIGKELLVRRPDVRVLLVGDAWSTEEYVAYQSRLLAAAPSEWREHFVFQRSVPYAAMPDLYARVAQTGGCLVSTSLFESAPMTFIEAMSCGCPVVSTNVGGAPELVTQERTGRLYEPGHVGEAVSAILDLLDEEKRPARDSMVSNARNIVAARHSPDTIAKEYRTLLESLHARVGTNDRRSRGRLSLSAESPTLPDVIPGLVSTIVPVYNRSKLLEEAVGSVLAQTYPNVEIILVDDGSTDDTGELCDRLAATNDRVRAFHIPHLGRAGLVRDVGRRAARGEYIQYLDSDDLLLPTKFEVMVAALEEHPDCDIAYCYTRRYSVGATPTDSPALLTGQAFQTIFPALMTRRYWFTSTPLYRRRVCDRAGPWTDLLFWEDVEYDIRIAVQAPKLYHCREYLTDFRDHETGRLSGSRFLDDPTLLREAVRGIGLMYESIKKAGLTHDLSDVRSFIDDVRVVYARCQRFQLEEEAARCRTMVMEAARVSDPSWITDYSVGAIIEPQQRVLTAKPGSSVVCPVRVTNASAVAFHGADFATELSYHLRGADGSMLQFEVPIRVIFYDPLGPGESRLVDLWIQAPQSSGLYYVEVDILWAGCTWLNAIGSPTTFLKLLVTDVAIAHRWWLNVAGEASAELVSSSGPPEVLRLMIESRTGTEPWHIQLNRESFPLVEAQEYILRFRARADQARRLMVGVARAHEPWDGLGLYRQIELSAAWQRFELEFTATDSEEMSRVLFDAGAEAPISLMLSGVELYLATGDRRIETLPFASPGRLQMDIGTEPASSLWGTDRGLAVHRYYLEQFLDEFTADIRGTCLEFQDPQYTPRFGGARVTTLEILHVDSSNPRATLVADLTKPNTLPSNHFDCIVCTHVLHVILDVQRAVTELFRILKPGGVLLVAVPHFSMYSPEEYGEIWRFTPRSLEILLSGAFRTGDVLIRVYGNSLTAAGEIRGVIASEFLRAELDHHDPRFPVEVCARAVKGA